MENPRVFKIIYWDQDGRRHAIFEAAVNWQAAINIANVPLDIIFGVKDMEAPIGVWAYRNDDLLAKFLQA